MSLFSRPLLDGHGGHVGWQALSEDSKRDHDGETPDPTTFPKLPPWLLARLVACVSGLDMSLKQAHLRAVLDLVRTTPSNGTELLAVAISCTHSAAIESIESIQPLSSVLSVMGGEEDLSAARDLSGNHVVGLLHLLSFLRDNTADGESHALLSDTVVRCLRLGCSLYKYKWANSPRVCTAHTAFYDIGTLAS
jgi:hypothetical protein